MAYYFRLEYYAAAPVSKNVATDWIKYADKHVHGLQPTQTEISNDLPNLYSNVADAYQNYNTSHPAAVVPYPGNIAVQQGMQVKTKSAS